MITLNKPNITATQPQDDLQRAKEFNSRPQKFESISQFGVSKNECASRDKNKDIIVFFVMVNSCKHLH